MKVIKIFEYAPLHVDGANFTQAHFDRLVKYNEQHGNIYFNVGYRCVYFKHYVGVLQVGNLIIEILPKADRNPENTNGVKDKWHNALIYMLRLCGYIKIDSMENAELNLQNITLIDLFYKLFLEEVKFITHQGLMRAYRHKTDNLPYLKGRLVFNRHLSENYLHKEQFYTMSQVYDHDNVYNQILYKALLVLKECVHKSDVFLSEICNLLCHFENISDIAISDKLFESLVFTRNRKKYQKAIVLARLILHNYFPDLKNGTHPVIGILFDMNTLFEKVMYRILKKYEEQYTLADSLLVFHAQNRKSFWGTKTIRPDILGHYRPSNDRPTEKFIIDTKWKIPRDGGPSDDDLKQMYAYNLHFGCMRSVLLYPYIEGSRDQNSPYEASEAVKNEFYGHSCSTYFIDIFDENGYIKKNAGEDLIKYLCTS